MLGLLAVLTIVIAACGGGDATDTYDRRRRDHRAGSGHHRCNVNDPATRDHGGSPPRPQLAGPTPQPEQPAILVIWADELRAAVIEEISPAFTDATGVGVEVQIVDFGDIRTQVTTQAPAGEGPDLFIGANDWTGELAANGVIEPIDLGSKSGDFFDLSLTAFSIDGQLYAVPYGYEAIALYYNTDMVPEPLASIEDAVAICEDLPDIENCIGLPGGGDGPDAYHHYPVPSPLAAATSSASIRRPDSTPRRRPRHPGGARRGRGPSDPGGRWRDRARRTTTPPRTCSSRGASRSGSPGRELSTRRRQ